MSLLRKPTSAAGCSRVDVEVRAREAEDDRGLVLVAEDGVDRDAAALGSGAANTTGRTSVPLPHAPDEVRALAPEEDGPQEIEGVEVRSSPRPRRGYPRALASRAPRRARDPPSPRRTGYAASALFTAASRPGRASRRRGSAPGGPSGKGRRLAASRTRRGRRRRPCGRSRREAELKKVSASSTSRLPGGERARRRAFIPDQTAWSSAPAPRIRPQVPEGGVEHPLVELEALECVRAPGAPVARREAHGRAARDRGELPRVRVPGGEEALGARAGRVVGGSGGLLQGGGVELSDAAVRVAALRPARAVGRVREVDEVLAVVRDATYSPRISAASPFARDDRARRRTRGRGRRGCGGPGGSRGPGRRRRRRGGARTTRS